jgi:hypothetical protein
MFDAQVLRPERGVRHLESTAPSTGQIAASLRFSQ